MQVIFKHCRFFVLKKLSISATHKTIQNTLKTSGKNQTIVTKKLIFESYYYRAQHSHRQTGPKNSPDS